MCVVVLEVVNRVVWEKTLIFQKPSLGRSVASFAAWLAMAALIS
jgi:hypothetical protein